MCPLSFPSKLANNAFKEITKPTPKETKKALQWGIALRAQELGMAAPGDRNMNA
ncbi:MULTISPECIES: hypothetical protein [unclassified Microcoleus]|uniref:hypothetical protein n=1 Tax=unclassified Microcoleus TaxID=2642155 RepID=UPI00312B9B11